MSLWPTRIILLEAREHEVVGKQFLEFLFEQGDTYFYECKASAHVEVVHWEEFIFFKYTVLTSTLLDYLNKNKFFKNNYVSS